MANREKYTRAAIGHMTAHYERKKDKKGNPISDITIDGGTGNDNLVLDNGAGFTDYQNIKTIKLHRQNKSNSINRNKSISKI